MKSVFANIRYWVAGVVTAGIGVMLARIVAPRATSSLRMSVILAGQFLAIGGLTLVAAGVSRRVKRGEKSSPEQLS